LARKLKRTRQEIDPQEISVSVEPVSSEGPSSKRVKPVESTTPQVEEADVEEQLDSPELEGVSGDQEGVAADQEGVSGDQEDMTVEQEEIPSEQEGLSLEQEGVSIEEEGMLQQDDTTVDQEGEQEGVSSDQVGVSNNQEGMSGDQEGVSTEQEAEVGDTDDMMEEQEGVVEEPEYPSEEQEVVALDDNEEGMEQGDLGTMEDDQIDYDVEGEELDGESEQVVATDTDQLSGVVPEDVVEEGTREESVIQLTSGDEEDEGDYDVEEGEVGSDEDIEVEATSDVTGIMDQPAGSVHQRASSEVSGITISSGSSVQIIGVTGPTSNRPPFLSLQSGVSYDCNVTSCYTPVGYFLLHTCGYFLLYTCWLLPVIHLFATSCYTLVGYFLLLATSCYTPVGYFLLYTCWLLPVIHLLATSCYTY
jgi:hypothetical protein